MKLYATTTSERASKGQGGNKYINIDLFYGERDDSIPAGSVYLRIDNNDVVVSYNDVELFRTELKGKKQKGEEDFCSEGHKHFTEKCWACEGNIPF